MITAPCDHSPFYHSCVWVVPAVHVNRRKQNPGPRANLPDYRTSYLVCSYRCRFSWEEKSIYSLPTSRPPPQNQYYGFLRFSRLLACRAANPQILQFSQCLSLQGVLREGGVLKFCVPDKAGLLCAWRFLLRSQKGLDSWSRLVSADLLLCALVWDFLVFLIVI